MTPQGGPAVVRPLVPSVKNQLLAGAGRIMAFGLGEEPSAGSIDETRPSKTRRLSSSSSSSSPPPPPPTAAATSSSSSSSSSFDSSEARRLLSSRLAGRRRLASPVLSKADQSALDMSTRADCTFTSRSTCDWVSSKRKTWTWGGGSCSSCSFSKGTQSSQTGPDIDPDGTRTGSFLFFEASNSETNSPSNYLSWRPTPSPSNLDGTSFPKVSGSCTQKECGSRTAYPTETVFDPANEKCSIQFKYHMYGGRMGKLQFGWAQISSLTRPLSEAWEAGNSGFKTWQKTFTGQQMNSGSALWKTANVQTSTAATSNMPDACHKSSLPGFLYEGSRYVVAFDATRGSDYTSDMAIADIVFSPSCFKDCRAAPPPLVASVCGAYDKSAVVTGGSTPGEGGQVGGYHTTRVGTGVKGVDTWCHNESFVVKYSGYVAIPQGAKQLSIQTIPFAAPATPAASGSESNVARDGGTFLLEEFSWDKGVKCGPGGVCAGDASRRMALPQKRLADAVTGTNAGGAAADGAEVVEYLPRVGTSFLNDIDEVFGSGPINTFDTLHVNLENEPVRRERRIEKRNERRDGPARVVCACECACCGEKGCVGHRVWGILAMGAPVRKRPTLLYRVWCTFVYLITVSSPCSSFCPCVPLVCVINCRSCLPVPHGCYRQKEFKRAMERTKLVVRRPSGSRTGGRGS